MALHVAPKPRRLLVRIARIIGFSAVTMLLGALAEQLLTQQPISVQQKDIMIGFAKPGGTLEMDIEKHVLGHCRNFHTERSIWRWKDKTKQSKLAGGERGYVAMPPYGKINTFDDDKFTVYFPLEGMPREPDAKAGLWHFETEFTPQCPWYDYPVAEWLDAPRKFRAESEPIRMAENGVLETQSHSP